MFQPADEPLLKQLQLPRGTGPAVLSAVILASAGMFGYAAGPLFGFVLIPQAFTVKLVALVAVLGYVGFSRPWWARIAALKWPVAASLRTPGSPAAVFLLGTVVAAPAATYVGVAAWASRTIGNSAWQGDLAGLRPWATLAAPAIAAVLFTAWRVCFAPPAAAWVRWVPLGILGVGAIVGVAFEPVIGVLTPSHLLACAVAVGWGVLLGLASPERLGYAVARPRTVEARVVFRERADV